MYYSLEVTCTTLVMFQHTVLFCFFEPVFFVSKFYDQFKQIIHYTSGFLQLFFNNNNNNNNNV